MKTVLKILVGIVIVIAVVVGFFFFRFDQLSEAEYTKPQFEIHSLVASSDVELGKRIYVVRAGCVECHGENGAGRLVMDNPAMGKIVGANLTPVTLSGVSDEDIATAIRYGIHPSGRSLRFMPSFDYEKLSKSDIAAVIAYIRTFPPVMNEPLNNSFGPIAKIMSVLGKMPVVFPAMVINPEIGFSEKPPEAANVEFGQYLANSCTGCHGQSFAGGPIPGGDPSWPQASNIRLGNDGFWTEEKFRQVIATGKSAVTGQDLRPPMPVALLKQMNETEIKALWEFLSSLK